MKLVINENQEFQLDKAPSLSGDPVFFPIVLDGKSMPNSIEGEIKIVETITWPKSGKVSDETTDIEEPTEFVLFSTDMSNWGRFYILGSTIYLTNIPEQIAIEPTEDEIAAKLELDKVIKKEVISSNCKDIIYLGLDVTLSSGAVKHFSFKEEDQINLKAISDLCISGKVISYPYHSQGELCSIYSSEDLITIANTLMYNKIYHTTYCNHLYQMIEDCTDSIEVSSITYGQELSEPYKTSFENIMSAVSTISD